MTATKRIAAAASEIGINATTLQRWTKRGPVPFLRSPANQRYLTEDRIREIERAMASRARARAAQYETPMLDLR